MLGVVLKVPAFGVVAKLGILLSLIKISAINLTLDSTATAVVFDTTNIISCPTGRVARSGCCSITEAAAILFYFVNVTKYCCISSLISFNILLFNLFIPSPKGC